MAIKAPSKTTQERALLLIEQTGNRIMQNKILDRVVNQFGEHKSGSTRATNKIAGALFWIKQDNNGNPSMVYDKRSNRRNSNFPKPVLKLCCENDFCY